MKPLIPCLDCGRLGPWRNAHGVRCRACSKTHENARHAAFRQLRLFEPDGPCAMCGATSDLTWDHVVPRSKGGTNEWSNLQCLCRRCNSKKGAGLPGGKA